MSIFLDLDGTLVNSQGRLYRLFCLLCPECTLSYDEYWEIKRSRISQADMLKKYYGYDDDKVSKFHRDWLSHVEDNDAVETDFPVEGISEWLSSIAKMHKLYLLTARQKPELVELQIERFGWKCFFSGLIVTRQSKSKCDAVQTSIGPVEGGAMVGDTGEDIRTAKELGLRSLAVGWGVLSPEILKEYKPDYLAERIEDLDNCPFI